MRQCPCIELRGRHRDHVTSGRKPTGQTRDASGSANATMLAEIVAKGSKRRVTHMVFDTLGIRVRGLSIHAHGHEELLHDAMAFA